MSVALTAYRTSGLLEAKTNLLRNNEIRPRFYGLPQTSLLARRAPDRVFKCQADGLRHRYQSSRGLKTVALIGPR
jgi:hypothetical protein